MSRVVDPYKINDIESKLCLGCLAVRAILGSRPGNNEQHGLDESRLSEIMINIQSWLSTLYVTILPRLLTWFQYLAYSIHNLQHIWSSRNDTVAAFCFCCPSSFLLLVRPARPRSRLRQQKDSRSLTLHCPKG